MYPSSSERDSSALRIRIDFSKSGRRDLRKVNNGLGKAAIPAPVLMKELAEYIEHRINSDDPMLEAFDVRYEDGVYLTVCCSGGIYYITWMTNIGTVIAAQAILIWTRVKHGCDYLLRRVLVGWRCITAGMKSTAYCL